MLAWDRMKRFSWAALAVLGAAACAAAGGDDGPVDDDAGVGGGSGGDDASVGASTSTGGASVTVGVGGGGGGETITEVFGHSGNTLYRLDPVTHVITEVGVFGNCGPNSVLDIALDKDSQLYAVKRVALYLVDRETAACTLIHELPSGQQYPDSLGFVPAGTLSPNVEALVGYQGADYVRIDPQSGAISIVAANTLPTGMISSGDIVSVDGGPTYLTIKGDSCGSSCPPDQIVEVDPATGAVIQNYGSVGYTNVFGIAFWGGSVYGFARDGDLFEVTFGANDVTTAAIPFPSAPPTLEFYGAGSSTAVPVVIPE